MRRPLATLALAALLVLAGCNFGPGGSGTSEPTATLSDGETPPGVENGTLTEPDALLANHTRLLVESGFETDVQTNATVKQLGRVQQVARRHQTIVEPGRSAYVYRVTNPESRIDVWGNESVVVSRARSGNETNYQRSDQPADTAVLSGQALLSRFLADGEYRVAAVDRRDGATYTTLETSTRPSDPGIFPQNASDVRDYTATLVVDGEGRVHSFVATATYTLDGEQGSYRVEYTLVRTDRPTVERPDWVEPALP